MNPLNWKREHKVALAIAIGTGCIFGIIVGYFVFASSALPQYGAQPFEIWLSYPIRYGVHWWAIVGGLFGGSIFYVKRLNSN